MAKKAVETKSDIYELTYKTTCALKVHVQAPSKKAAEAWSDTYGDEFVDDVLEEKEGEWDEQEGGFEEVVKLSKAEAAGVEPDVVVDADGEPEGGEEKDDGEDDEEEDDTDDADEDDEDE